MKRYSEFEASTHDWAADEKAVSGEDAEIIPTEEFFKDGECCQFQAVSFCVTSIREWRMERMWTSSSTV